jgi:hypothetical protein
MFKKILNIILMFSLLGEFFNSASAQNAPVTTASTITDAIAGQQVTVQITVTGFNNIGSVSLTMVYDPAKLQYVSGSFNSALTSSGTPAIGDSDINGMRRVKAGWFSINGASLPDGTAIITVIFSYITGSSILEWSNDALLGNICEYTDPTGLIKLNATPFSTYFINGLVSGLTTGISPILSEMETQGFEFNIYPNPAADLINLKLSEYLDRDLQFSISSVNGTIMKKFKMKLRSSGEVPMIDIHDLKPGLYYMSVSFERKKVTRKFIVIRQ